MKWIYHEEPYKNKTRIHGQCVFADVQYRFTGTFDSSISNCGKITVSVISPVTGKILQISGPKRRKIENTLSEKEKRLLAEGKQVEKLNAQMEIYPSSRSEAEIKKHISKAVAKLYSDNYYTLMDQLKKSSASCSTHALGLYYAFQNSFIRKMPPMSESTKAEKKESLRYICALLDDSPISELSVKELRGAYLLIDSKADWKFNLAASFFAFCAHQGAFQGKNPFESYYSAYPRGKKSDPQKAASLAVKPHRLDIEQESFLLNWAKNNIDSPFALALALVKDARLNMNELHCLKWSDIVFTMDGFHQQMVLIKNNKPDYTGGTHNYTRPPLPAAQALLRTKHELLLKKYRETSIRKMYVVPSTDDPMKPMEIQKITAHIRQLLLRSGASSPSLASAGMTKSIGGAGMLLLHDHYDYVLDSICGIDIDSGIGRYLRGKPINDVTTDYYVSLSGLDGASLLQGILRRDGRFIMKAQETAEPNEPKIADDGAICKKITIPAYGSDQLSGVILKINLPPGGSLEIYSDYGVFGNVKVPANPHRRKAAKSQQPT